MWETILSSTKAQTAVFSLGSKCFNSLSHLAGPS